MMGHDIYASIKPNLKQSKSIILTMQFSVIRNEPIV